MSSIFLSNSVFFCIPNNFRLFGAVRKAQNPPYIRDNFFSKMVCDEMPSYCGTELPMPSCLLQYFSIISQTISLASGFRLARHDSEISPFTFAMCFSK